VSEQVLVDTNTTRPICRSSQSATAAAAAAAAAAAVSLVASPHPYNSPACPARHSALRCTAPVGRLQ